MIYDESDNPSNGWRVPDELEESERLEPGDISSRLADLEPNEHNPLERKPLKYNPLNHAYPMVAETPIGAVEVMVKFELVRGKEGLPTDMLASAPELQVPVATEDVPVVSQEFDEKMDDQLTRDLVSESALRDEMAFGSKYYLIPAIVRARKLFGGESEVILGDSDSMNLLTEAETAALFTGSALLDLIVGYAHKVAGDPDAPAALKDMLHHFRYRAGQDQPMPPVPITGPDDEWQNDDDDDDDDEDDYDEDEDEDEDEEEDDADDDSIDAENIDDGHDPNEKRRWDWNN